MTQDLKTVITPPAGTVDVMVDLETMSTQSNAAIVSIGACWFNPDTQQVGHPFHVAVDLNSSIEIGSHIDGDTVRWWLQQSAEAREAIARPDGQVINTALRDFALYLHGVAPASDVRVWGNGADFDLPILSNAYRACLLPVPWRYYNGRCFRTLRKLHPEVQAPVFTGVEHNAADDAQHQAEHAIAILRAIDGQRKASIQLPPTLRAVHKVLDRMQRDGRLAWLIGPGSDAFDQLCAAMAADTGRTREAVAGEIAARLNPQRVVLADPET